MFKFRSPLAASALISLSLSAAPASAGPIVTFVSGKGTDSGNCQSPATPFQFALGQTSAGGEIKALDPANYGSMTLTKAISIEGVEGASIAGPAAGESGITINAGPNDVINISRLIIDGGKAGGNGILGTKFGALRVTHCTIQNINGFGINTGSFTSSVVLIADTVVSDNAATGVALAGAQGTLDHVNVNHNQGGIFVEGPGAVSIVNCTITNNRPVGIGNQFTGVGIDSQGADVRLDESVVTGNSIGIRVGSVAGFTGSTGESAGNNFISGNGTDIVGTLTNVGTK